MKSITMLSLAAILLFGSTIMAIAKSHNYGELGKNKVEIDEKYKKNVVVYHPTSWTKKATPVVIFIPGGNGSSHHRGFSTILNFVASHGNTVLFIPRDVKPQSTIDKILNENKSRLDKSKIGIIGWSNGGGATFKLLKDLSAKKYGKKGRFIFVMDSWTPQYMDIKDLEKIVNTNAVFMQFCKDGNSTNPRIPITTYNLLTGKGIDKNYIVLSEAKGHSHLTKKNMKEIQGILKPLDALMDFTFNKKSRKAHKIALEGPGKKSPQLAKIGAVIMCKLMIIPVIIGRLEKPYAIIRDQISGIKVMLLIC